MVGLGGARLRFKLKGRNLEAFTKIRIVKNWLDVQQVDWLSSDLGSKMLHWDTHPTLSVSLFKLSSTTISYLSYNIFLVHKASFSQS